LGVLGFKTKRFVKVFLVISVIMLFASRDLLPAVNALVLELGQKQGRIVIFSDGIDPSCSLLAGNLYRVVKRFYPYTERIQVYSFEELAARANEEFFIRAYVFRGELNGLRIGYNRISWEQFAELLKSLMKDTVFGPTVHIVASGDAHLLKEHLEFYEGFYIESSPIIDVKLSYFYHLWTIADVLGNGKTYRSEEMLEAGERLRKCALIYFSEEFNDLVSKVIEPVNTLGELPPGNFSIDHLMQEAKLTQIYPNTSTPAPQKPVLFMGSPNQNSYSSKSAQKVLGGGSGSSGIGQGSGYIPFVNLTIKSGVDGPVGKIIDAILEFFFNKLGDWGLPPWLGVSVSFLSEVKNYLGNFTSWLNRTVTNWFKDNLPWIVLGGTVTLQGLFIAAAADEWARAKLGELLKEIMLQCDKFINDLLKKLNNLISGLLNLKYEIDGLPVGFSDFSLFKFFLKLEISPGFSIDSKAFTEFINGTLFGEKEFTWESILSIINIIPTFSVELSIKSFGTEKNGLVKKLFEMLGLDVVFSGGAKLVMELLKVKATFKSIEFFNIKEWAFKFTLEIKKRFTIFDFFTAGVGGSVLAKAAEYIGLGHFYIDVFFKIAIEIVKTVAEAGKNATSKFTLDIILGMTADLKVLIVAIKGGFEVTWRFIQDLLADTPLEIFLILHLWFKVNIDLWLFDFDVGKWEWWPLGEGGTRIAGGKNSNNYKQNAMGLDTDMDGLSDAFETRIGLNINLPDSDGDGLSDKFELDVSKTKPDNPDSDGDRLNDGSEVNNYLTDPLRKDTDWDNITDYDEIMIYKTNPLLYDTDKDGLSDYYEINTTYDFTGTKVTPTVTSVKIGGVTYYNHTDPLDPDTDGDGLLDGQEGYRRGTYYGNKALNGSDPSMFNFGYTHPLDYDTDDDSYEQLADGTLTERKLFYLDWNDGIEIQGKLFNFVNVTTGESYSKVVHTNPCNPDTDNDTASAIFLNSDGRELSLTPPTDPTNGDTDSDGLLDGEEGTLSHKSYHTDPNNPDTDNDKLSDGEEVKKGMNPLNPDFDGDQVCDGDEVYRYFTDPRSNDTDGDLLLDGEELFKFYSDPFVRDSDNDTIIDGYEAHIYGTDPVNPDTDSDGLPDNIEIFILRTDPLNPDTDGDGISDFDEVSIYYTNPLSWDSDGDSITALNEFGEMTLPCGDHDEIFKYGTNPLSSDSDKDGLTDAQELYLAKGSPGFSPILLNPLNNDTDSDGLLDGAELRITTINTLFYPYTAHVIEYPYGCLPVNNDTDNDGLLDGVEILTYHTNPNATDTDNDALSDFDEVNTYMTNPANNDTDGDDLADNVEIFGLPPLPTGVRTNATNSDTDGDLLPDKAELLYGTDPLDPDSDNDGVADGAEFDYDDDGLNDGDEFYNYKTNHAVTITATAHSGINITSIVGYPAYLIIGGFDNADSDIDNLTDGEEVHTYHTDPVKSDTDGDGFSDGDEVAWGTDPLSWTSLDEVLARSKIPLFNLYTAIFFAIGLVAGITATFLFVRFRTRQKKKPPEPQPSTTPSPALPPSPPPSEPSNMGGK